MILDANRALEEMNSANSGSSCEMYSSSPLKKEICKVLGHISSSNDWIDVTMFGNSERIFLIPCSRCGIYYDHKVVTKGIPGQ